MQIPKRRMRYQPLTYDFRVALAYSTYRCSSYVMNNSVHTIKAMLLSPIIRTLMPVLAASHTLHNTVMWNSPYIPFMLRNRYMLHVNGRCIVPEREADIAIQCDYNEPQGLLCIDAEQNSHNLQMNLNEFNEHVHCTVIAGINFQGR